MRGALPFVRQQKMLYAASVDAEGQVWASVLIGEAGFLNPSDDAASLSVDLSKVAKQPHDPLWDNLRRDDRIGLLLLDLQTRKRLKVNGDAHLQGEELIVQVTESVPICPRYIQRRTLSLEAPGQQPPLPTAQRGTALAPAQIELITHADTFFLASAHDVHGADCSHRGGPIGFVKIQPNGVLRIPDYNGNSMFNSFGNFLLNPRAGLTFPDYARRRMLQLTGTVEMFWDQPDPDDVTGGTGRFWEFTVDRWIDSPLPDQLQSEFVDASPFLPAGH
ncbi:pyridoxamine 5'-phosphate oxidase family protein [Paucibacter sp. R3-3]|uniref:Pyridoxamine 5'-phosphate oxidase family protein n=1 Tax=Roseateles agri TaxID=3098619 RepID=A0ABU5DKE6_9BURK|nr:pyridoxamine 5'-phosphate oxidase family protein [Paucibacter sp. R3-3]MDY0746766.1 pyridoxamine 5'-phosphate oxidase family protein [Paucibacter sp. R3-3]